MSQPSDLSDESLLGELHRLARSQHRVMAALVSHLGEMDARRLYANEGFPSLFAYSVEVLGFSEDEACRRIEAARLARKFPAVHALLETGGVTLTVLALLKPHLTCDNHQELFDGISGKSVRQAKEWLAIRFPLPGVPWSIRKRPERARACLVPAAAAGAPQIASAPLLDAAPAPEDAASALENAAPAPARIEPLSSDLFFVKLTVSRDLKEKLLLARDLMSHANRSGDLSVVLERAVDALLVQLEKKKLGATHRPAGKARPARRTHVASATRREVVARDGLRCSFVAPDGHLCAARAFLEFDHVTPRGLGGGSEPRNVRVLCHAHNRLAAERVYGRARLPSTAFSG